MEKVVICTREEMNQLQYVEDIQMTFEERLKLAFEILAFSKAFSPVQHINFDESPEIEWTTLKMIND